MRWPPVVCSFLAAFLLAGVAAAAETVNYVTQVKPLLAGHCYACHGALKQEAGLRLDTAELTRKGGESGLVVVAGNSAKSSLIERIAEKNVDNRMPPENEGTPLTESEIAVIRDWIDQGAAGPADEKPEADPREHWAFRSPVRPQAPTVKNKAWVRNPIDAFVAAEHERQKLTPQPAADKRLLLRRVYLDLIGLPPTVREQEAFITDATPDAYERTVDRLLASPQYGERWGRHWMDLWRYSDWWGLGAEVRNSQKHIWHWRDWIIESLNEDVGYDEMVRQMLAADELYPQDLAKLRATGFLVRNYFKFNRNTWMEETIEHTSKAFLGMTINCSRCHDHKYDPISQIEYYRLRAFFEPYQVRTDQIAGEGDLEKDGIPRVFDCHLDAPTYRFLRGDEKRPDKERLLTPSVPGVLSFDDLAITPVSLPAEAHQPGLRPWVLGNLLAVADKQLAAAQAEFEKAQKSLAAIREQELAAQKLAQGPPADGKKPDPQLDKLLDEDLTKGKPGASKSAETKPADVKPADAKTAGGTAKPADASAKATKLQIAETEFKVAQQALAAAELLAPALRARAAADRARYESGTADSGDSDEVKTPDNKIAKLAEAAARADKRQLAAKADESVARAELAVLQAADGKKKGDAEKKLATAREAAAKAHKEADAPGSKYTRLTGALKALESSVETADERLRPFPSTSSGRRSALAHWLTDARHPLTARVAVNQIWMRHMGKPLVPTIFEFGRKGLPPTNPALLDGLANEFMDSGWNMKQLHRLIVTSNVYRLTSSSAGAAESLARDPENRHYWRMNPVRMEAQVVRDAMLRLSSGLDTKMGGASIDPVASEMSPRRSMYFVHSHNDHHRFLSVFDDASVQECYRREESIVPQQALALFNSKLAADAAAKIADQLNARPENNDDDAFIRAAFATVLACEPSVQELATCTDALADLKALASEEKQQGKTKEKPAETTRRARTHLILALLNHNDFLTVR